MKNLETYLNDHLAGSVGALEMLAETIESQKGEPLEQFLRGLRDEIEADQGELKRLIKQLGIEESSVRKAGAWVAEKFSRVKLGAGSGKTDLDLLQSLEGLSLGIAGKRSLWRTLGQLTESAPALRAFDFAELERRALDQFERAQAKVTEIGSSIFPAELRELKNDG